MIVTGANSSHYRSLLNCLRGLFIHMPAVRVVVFDLGLSAAEHEKLARAFKTFDLRKFNYSKYPGYFNIKVEAGAYAWKPIIISDVMHEFQCDLLWMDAGTIVHEPLNKVRELIHRQGFHAVAAGAEAYTKPYTVGKFTRGTTLALMDCPDHYRDKGMVLADFIGVSHANDKARTMVDEYKRYALIEECIAPTDCGKHDHAHDQSIISVLVYRFGLEPCLGYERYGYTARADID